MAKRIRAAFEPKILTLDIGAILPLRNVADALRHTVKYRRIAQSVREVGIIEPLVVARSGQKRGQYLLLDGHIRLAVLAELGASEVKCLISEDDEGFTYNKRINRLAVSDVLDAPFNCWRDKRVLGL